MVIMLDSIIGILGVSVVICGYLVVFPTRREQKLRFVVVVLSWLIVQGGVELP